MINYKQSSVIDQAGYYIDFVLVIKNNVILEDGTETAQWVIQGYTLQDGESLVDTKRPRKRVHAGDVGLVRHRWDGTQWVEGASTDEIVQWELDNPAPTTVPTTTEQLRADVDFLALMGGISL